MIIFSFYYKKQYRALKAESADVQSYLVEMVHGMPTVKAMNAQERDRIELRHRGQRAGAPDLDIDGEQRRFGLFGGEFMRRRPSRAARHLPQPRLPIEPFDLVDHPVDIERQVGPPRLDIAGKGQRIA